MLLKIYLIKSTGRLLSSSSLCFRGCASCLCIPNSFFRDVYFHAFMFLAFSTRLKNFCTRLICDLPKYFII